MIETPVVLADIPISSGWRQIQIKTETNTYTNKYRYKDRYLAGQCCCGWDLTQWSAPGTIPVQLAPLSTCLTHSTLLEARFPELGNSRFINLQILWDTQGTMTNQNEQGSDLAVQPGDGDKHCICDISYDMKCGQTPGWCWQLKNVRQDTGVHQRPAGNWGSCSCCWESESDSEKEEADGLEMDALAKFWITVL